MTVQDIERIASSNEFWALSSGDHLNMIDTLLEEIERLNQLVDVWETESFRANDEIQKMEEEQPEPTETVDTLKEHYTDHTTKLLNRIYGEEEEGK